MWYFVAETYSMFEIKKKKTVKCVVIDDLYVTSFTLVAIYQLTKHNIPVDKKHHYHWEN